MLRVSVGFLLISLVSLTVGLRHLWGFSFELGRIFFFIFLGIAFLCFLLTLIPRLDFR
jgi:hypothetical protein